MNHTSFKRLVQQLIPGATLQRVWPLQGGMSAEMIAFEMSLPAGGTKAMVVRCPNSQSGKAVVEEFNILSLLQSSGVRVPQPVYLDERGMFFDKPALVMSYMVGEPIYAPTDPIACATQIGAQLAQIHRIDSSQVDIASLGQQAEDPRARFQRRVAAAAAREIDIVREVADRLTAVWPLPQQNKPTLLHGDFWPGNMLWQDGRLVAIVDWEDVTVGDPLEDFAISRFDLYFIFGEAAYQAFTHTYQSLSSLDFSQLPYWDLYAALRLAPLIPEIADGWPELGRPDLTETTIRRAHAAFIEQALAKL